MLNLHLHHTVATAVQPTPRVCQVASMFGLGVDEQRNLELIPPTDLTLRPGQLIFITGASGGGKTTLLRNVAAQLREDRQPGPRATVIDFQSLPLPQDDRALIDTLPGPLETVTRQLALAGLNDAFVMLRKPAELSDGQRYRYRLAMMMSIVESAQREDKTDPPLTVILADEFGSTLDRATAAILARNIRKWVTRQSKSTPLCLLAATTHDDLLEPLQPDTLIVQHPGEAMQVVEAG